MNLYTRRLVSSCFLLVLTILLGLTSQAPSYAGLSDEEKALWGKSADCPLTFVVDSSLASAVMGKAQGLISDWKSVDRYMAGMKIETVTDSLIQTYNPIEIGSVGFQVTNTKLPQGNQISVEALYYTGNLFSMRQDSKDALKRARLLSYILQQYAKTLTPTVGAQAEGSTVGAQRNDSAQPLPEEFELYMKLTRTQLAEGRYDAALQTLVNFKTSIENKAKQLPATAPAAQVLGVPVPATPILVGPQKLKVGGQVYLQLGNGSSVNGTLVSFDGTSYIISTPTGERKVKPAEVEVASQASK